MNIAKYIFSINLVLIVNYVHIVIKIIKGIEKIKVLISKSLWITKSQSARYVQLMYAIIKKPYENSKIVSKSTKRTIPSYSEGN